MQHKLSYKFNQNKPRKGVSYKAVLEKYKQPLPKLVDLRHDGFMPPIEDQGNEGDCAAHATAGALEYLQMIELQSARSSSLVFDPAGLVRVSRQQLYWGGRLIEGSTGEDSGISDLNDMATVAKVTGVARESLWPYTSADLFNAPPPAVMADASAHKLPESYSVSPGYQIKHCLWSGYPFMLGFQVFESFMDQSVAESGEMPMPAVGDQIVGGHAVLAVGYDDLRQSFVIRNSWGSSWGMDGYFYMPYEFMDSQYAGDFVTLRLSDSASI